MRNYTNYVFLLNQIVNYTIFIMIIYCARLLGCVLDVKKVTALCVSNAKQARGDNCYH